MRLIDANEALNRAKQPSIFDLTDVPEFLDECPTIDAIPVIRCKDCKYFLPYLTDCETTVEKADGNCGLFVLGDVQFVARQINDFCSYGERKEASDD